ncbi:hypothetical protein GGX14DRAFT_411898 [Mycena pura]|uniref:Uncharacterized protein n=1 Tax=Mycena pura TaxID=153505 RepID=A0AAD7E669_9AGAR|nr:hypothetical protein GGX14DRAFT_411898 [Mycena pura]
MSHTILAGQVALVPTHDPAPSLVSSARKTRKPGLKRPRISEPDILFSTKEEAINDEADEADPPLGKSSRKNAYKMPIPSIEWSVVNMASSALSSAGTTRGYRGRGRSRGGRGRGRLRAETAGRSRSLRADSGLDFPNDSTAPVSNSEPVKPRQWASSKEELFAIIPELTAHVNGIASDIFETPIILLEGSNGMSVSRALGTRNARMEITILRDFLQVASSSALEPPAHSKDYPAHSTVPMPLDFYSAPFDQQPASLPPWRLPQAWNGSVNLSSIPEFDLGDVYHHNRLLEGTSDLFAFKEVQEASSVIFQLPTTGTSSVNTEIDSELRVPIVPNPPSHCATPTITSTQNFTRVPRPIPKEIQILVDAYIHNTPVLCIGSKECISQTWDVTLPDEVLFAYLGFHTVVCAQEAQIDQNSTDTTGRVKWQFHLQWGPGGEEHLGLPSETLDLNTPWWLPRPNTGEITVVEPTPIPTDVSTESYKQQRLESPNYRFSNTPIANRCPSSILPLHLLLPYNEHSEEGGFYPEQQEGERNGWYCVDCGKLNRVVMMRHRRCNSSLCASKISPCVRGFSVSLDRIRTPHDALPAYMPNNTLPLGVDEPTVDTWPDGMVVLHYLLDRRETAGNVVDPQQLKQEAPQREVSAMHIFTGNALPLQRHATELLESIQVGCELVRETNDSPFFRRTAVEQDTEWPECLIRAREVIAQSIKTYTSTAEKDFDIPQLLVRGWVDSGSYRVILLYHFRLLGH